LKVKIGAEAIAAIEAILKRDRDVVIYRCKGGYIISEQTRTTKYRYTTQETE
jgi:hypothetical protein